MNTLHYSKRYKRLIITFFLFLKMNIVSILTNNTTLLYIRNKTLYLIKEHYFTKVTKA